VKLNFSTLPPSHPYANSQTHFSNGEMTVARSQEKPVRWIPFIAFFLYVYIEISIFIQVAHVFGVLMTLILVLFTSVIGME